MRVAIIGAGMSGLCMGLKLRQAGIDDFTIVEKASDLGGTWRDNTYPGLTCDVPAPFYAYSFALNPNWSHRFSTASEIHSYLRSTAARGGLIDRIRFGAEVVSTRWTGAQWELSLGDGAVIAADVVVAATGVLHRPIVPSFPGAERFRGAAFHSSQWDHSTRVDGARVGVIGTGSTGVQIVTALSKRSSQVVHFQRTPQWILPIINQPYMPWSRALQRRFPRLMELSYRYQERSFEVMSTAVVAPGWQRRAVQGLSRAFLRTVRDPELRARLTPDYEPLCKRLIVSAGYYRAVQRPAVSVVAGGISEIDETGVIDAGGHHHELDVIVYATGFDAHAFLRPMSVVGEGGRTLEQAWADGPRAHRTVSLPGFPNLFLLMGPNSPIGNTSLVPIAEAQASHVLRWIERIRAGEIDTVAPTAEATADFNQLIRDNMGETVWVTGCDSWYLGPDGSPTLWPFSPLAFREMLASVDDREYVLTAARER